ncbi:MAG: RNA polymerase sigma factor [Bacteroidota bacterium]|nr:RNA polymerase sigma factor [Bacteroidota bacterium]
MTTEQYNTCVKWHSDGVYRFILKNIRDEDKAKDIVQDSFEKLWIQASKISFDKSKSYLFSTAYHKMIDKIRKDKKIVDIDDKDKPEQFHNKSYTGLNEILNSALEKLSDIQRSVILLRDYEGYSYNEIADLTDLNESQVKVYIYRGRLALKKYIGSIEAVI